MDLYHNSFLPQRALLPPFVFEARMGNSKDHLFHPSHPHFNTDSNPHILERW